MKNMHYLVYTARIFKPRLIHLFHISWWSSIEKWFGHDWRGRCRVESNDWLLTSHRGWCKRPLHGFAGQRPTHTSNCICQSMHASSSCQSHILTSVHVKYHILYITNLFNAFNEATNVVTTSCHLWYHSNNININLYFYFQFFENTRLLTTFIYTTFIHLHNFWLSWMQTFFNTYKLQNFISHM